MATKYKVPSDIGKMSVEDLSKELDAAVSAYGEFSSKDDADLTDEDADYVLELAQFATAAKETIGQHEQAMAERSEKLGAARAALAVKPKEEEIPAIAEEEIPPGEEVEGEDEVEKRAKSAASGTEAASGKRVSLTRQAAKNSKPADSAPVNRAPGVSLVAAADVRGVPAGKEYSSLVAAGEAIQSRLDSYPKGAMVKGLQSTLSALQFKLPAQKFNNVDYLGRHNEMLMEISKESRLTGGSLIAAGGWGAPSDLVRDFCEIEDIGNLIDLPEFSVIHGGVQYTKGPTFADVFGSDTGFWDMTEAVAEAGTELKTSIRPKIPPFVEERLDAVGAMMECGLLLRAGYPALVERYASLVMTAHEFKIAMKKHALLEAFLGAAHTFENGFGNALDILHILELVATGERQRQAMSITQTMEVVIPFWVRPAIRADLANRTGVSDFTSVSDEQINAHFTARNMKVQWVNAFQNLDIDPVTKIAKAYPDSFRLYMYPAGTFVVGKADVITLDTIYDSVNLKKNDYVHLFTEQGMLLTNPCGDGIHLEVPLTITGKTAIANIDRRFGFATTAGV